MAVARLNDDNLLSLDLTIPRNGVWTADCQLEGTAAPAAGTTVSLFLGDTARSGTIVPRRTAAPYGQPRCRVVGGRGKLDVVLSPRDFAQTVLANVVRSILGDAGETAGDLAALNTVVVRQWQRVREPAQDALQRALRNAPQLDLWCERSGALSVRQTQWSTTLNKYTDYRGIVPQEKLVVLFADDGAVEPGVRVRTLQGGFDVERVQYVLDPNDQRSALKALCWYV